MARPSTCSWAALVGCAVALAAPSPASAQPSEIRVAVYAPWAGPSTADERFAFGTKLSDAVAAAGLGTVKVSSFVRIEDFRRALGNTRIDIALVDSGASTLLGARLQVAASWSSGGRWLLAGTSRPKTLQGKRLALQAADAPSSKQVVQRLLRQQVDTSYWKSVIATPVTADARQLVLRGGADLVIVPQRAATDLTEIADLGTFSELVLAVRGDKLGDVTAAIQQAVSAQLGGAWQDGAPRFPAAVGLTRLQTIAAELRSVSFLNLLARPPSAPPGLAVDEMWIEPDAR